MGLLRMLFGGGKNPYPAIASLKVKDCMTREVMTIDPQKSLIQAAHTMIGAHTSCLVVSQENKPQGILTERDFIKKLQMGREPKTGILVSDLMTSKLVLASPDTTLFEAQKIMRRNGFRKLVVAEKGELKGILTQTDLCKAVANLKTPIAGAPLVKDVMTTKPVMVSSEESFEKVKKIMTQKNMGSVIVADDDSIRGMFTEFDIVSEFFMNPNKLKNSCMKEVMTFPVVCITPDFDLEFVNKLMLEKNFRRLPVLEEGKLVGIITQTDVVREIYAYIEKNKGKKNASRESKPGFDIIMKGSTILYRKKKDRSEMKKEEEARKYAEKTASQKEPEQKK
ncbi:CBS domain-containing protein [Candidatus Woesearchaeota archaeon]|nr:CBS domain-containing protein [Candidatus Woesearchaeota archaeon]